MAPSLILEGRQKMDLSKKRVEFGAYVLAYVGTSNNMRKRGVPAIALKASNEVGGFYFMSPYSGKKIHSYIWNKLPNDDYVIRRVEKLAAEENRPLLLDNHPFFEWGPGMPINDDENANDENAVDEQQVIQVNDLDELDIIDENEEENKE